LEERSGFSEIRENGINVVDLQGMIYSNATDLEGYNRYFLDSEDEIISKMMTPL
jgi:hypothetical protein